MGLKVYVGSFGGGVGGTGDGLAETVRVVCASCPCMGPGANAAAGMDSCVGAAAPVASFEEGEGGRDIPRKTVRAPEFRGRRRERGETGSGWSSWREREICR